MGALRQVARYSPEKESALQMALLPDITGSRGGMRYRCNQCGGAFSRKEVHVDHKEPVVPVFMTLEEMTWDTIIARLFCEPDKLQVLCKPCHLKKSKEENKERRANRRK